MKKPLLISAWVLALLAVSATLFAQTTTGSSLITEMKAGIRTFTLAADLNPGITGLQSAAVSGKKTGDMLTAGEWNRMLELVAQGGGGGAGASNPLIICEKNFSVSATNNNGYTFVSADCGGTLPDNTYIGVLSKYGIPGGEYHPNVINAGETVGGYAGPGFFVWSVSAAAGTGYVRIVFIKKSGLVGGGGGGGGGGGLTLLSSYPQLDCFELGTTDYTCTGQKATLSATPTPYTLDLATVSGVTVPAWAQLAYICATVRTISSQDAGGAVSIGSGPGNVGASSPSHGGTTDRDHGGDSNCWFTPLVQNTKISYTFNKGPTNPLGAWWQISLAGFYGGGGGTVPAASDKICLFVYTSGTGTNFNSHAHAVHGRDAWTNQTCYNYVKAGQGGAASVSYYLGCVTDAGVTYGTASSLNPTTANAGIPSPNCGW